MKQLRLWPPVGLGELKIPRGPWVELFVPGRSRSFPLPGKRQAWVC